MTVVLSDTANHLILSTLSASSTETANIACVDAMYCYLFFNNEHKNTVRQAWGIDIFLGSSLLEIIPGSAERTALKQKLDKAFKGQTFMEIKEQGDIDKHEWETVYGPMYNSQGNVAGVNIYSKNITKRKEIERKFEENPKKYPYLFNHMAEGFVLGEIICDKNGIPCDYRILEVNEAYEQQCGIKSSDIIGKTVLEFYPDIEKSWIEIYGEVALTKKSQTFVNYNHNTGRHYETSAFAYEKGQFALIFKDVTERNKATELLQKSGERLAHMAHHDPLTGLPNRLRFIANLEQAIESAKRHKHRVALMYLDLDRFKYINDTLGHPIGDELLKIIAVRLLNCVRAEDTIARLGGDEFTVILTEVKHAEDANGIADTIINTVSKPVTVSGKTFVMSASVGISIYPDDGLNAEDMLKVADIAMYQAKTDGKNCFRFFTPELALRAVERRQIEKDLRKALENEEFELLYQPQVSLADGKITGIEALIRWNHPEKGQILPEKFISVADDLNLIDAISEWVLRTAFNDYQQWLKNNSKGLRIAVNITIRQISNEQSVKHILKVLEELSSATNINHLDFEITEGALEKTKHTISTINNLRDRGVKFSIDDFGTGYSPLRRLNKLPIGALKIDRSFIIDIASDGGDKAIVAAIIAMAHSLSLRVIGEGVETKSQLDVLRALECDEIQGFYFSKPVPASEIAQLLEKTYQR
jgi:diguanylate cyclase (GGDEF)-like protein